MEKQELDILYYHFSGLFFEKEFGKDIFYYLLLFFYNLSAPENGKWGYQA